ncbi:TorF family putative porin [Sphingomonas sp.]|uniref:TorF family putative porin n=1 Tax=Sphingomonas sp. TaxID=28214 RepID=UPI002DD65DFC|nr:TorF family putative porin [Sphingomonas sp.]
MLKTSFAGAIVLAMMATPALGQSADAPSASLSVSGSATLISDYRFRGVSQSDGGAAVQARITVAHDSGVYAGVWGSNLAGWGTFGGPNMELDLIGGVKRSFAGGSIDAGLTWFMYPGGAKTTDFGEVFVKLSGTTGPVTLTGAVAYAPKQRALGRVFGSGAAAAAGTLTRPGAKGDNLYLSGDGALTLSGTPVTLKGHIGHSRGNRGLGPNATSVAPTGRYWDWSLGADVTPVSGLTLGVAWVGTDIGRRESAYFQPFFSRGQDGSGAIAGSTLLASLTASF